METNLIDCNWLAHSKCFDFHDGSSHSRSKKSTKTPGIWYKCLYIHFLLSIPFGMYHSYDVLCSETNKITYNYIKKFRKKLTSDLAGWNVWFLSMKRKLRGGRSLRTVDANEFQISRWVGLLSEFKPARPTKANGRLTSSAGTSKSLDII